MILLVRILDQTRQAGQPAVHVDALPSAHGWNHDKTFGGFNLKQKFDVKRKLQLKRKRGACDGLWYHFYSLSTSAEGDGHEDIRFINI